MVRKTVDRPAGGQRVGQTTEVRSLNATSVDWTSALQALAIDHGGTQLSERIEGHSDHLEHNFLRHSHIFSTAFTLEVRR